MPSIEYFLQTPETRKYNIQGHDIKLEVNDKVFPPPKEAPILARNIKVNPGEKVIDVGTGSGILAITAAKMGGKVTATDRYFNAVELAKRNAKLNQCDIDFVAGSFFEALNGKFDVIIANLSQTVVAQNYQEAIGQELAGTISGGEKGNETLLQFLSDAREHMHEKSRLYTVVYSVSDYLETFEKIRELYNVKLLEHNTEPTKEFVEQNIDQYLKMDKAGKISIFKDEKTGKWTANQFAVELTLK